MADTDRDEAETHRYPNVVRFVRETPWAILESKLQEISEIIRLRANGVELTDEEIQARVGAGPARRQSYVTDGQIAVIPVYGAIVPRADLMSQISGGTSVQGLQASLRDAVGNPDIKGILLDIDSPGGSVDMIAELAQEIRNARKQKPVVAVANTMAASAAYWLGSQASSLSVTPSGSVGSIGVIAMHDDVSAMNEKLGVKTTTITAGKYKGELSPYAPLTEEARASAQDRVDKFYGMFTQDVAYGRGVPVGTVKSDFGQGRMLLAKDALTAGMVDQIETYDQALTRLSSGTVQKGGRPRAEGFEDGAWALDEPPDDDESPPGDDTDTEDLEAADSGLSFALTYAEQADALHANAKALLERTTSLAEVKRGALTGAKRDRLTACTEALRETVTRFDGVLAATSPSNHADDEARRSRDLDLLRVRLNLRGGDR